MIKSYHFFKRNFNLHSFCKFSPIFLLFLLFFAGGIGKTGAQTTIATITWEQEPIQHPHDLNILGNPGYIHLNVMLEDDPANNAAWTQPRIKIDLPAGIDFSQENVTAGTRADNILINEEGLTPINYFTVTTAPTGLALSGTRTITLAYVGSPVTNTLALGDSIVIKVRIRALWEANVLNPGAVTVTLLSGNNQTLFGGVTKICQLNLTRPSLRIMPSPGFSETIIIPTILVDTMPVSVDIDAQQGHTRSAYINYAYRGDVVYLDSFKLDGKLLNILPSNSGAGIFHQNRTLSTAMVHIRLDQSNLDSIITSHPRTLTFTATANRGCNWNLTPWIQNPLVPAVAPSVATSYDRWNTNVTVLSLPGVRGAPTFVSQRATVPQYNSTGNPILMRTTSRFNLEDPYDMVNLTTPTDIYSGNGFNSFCWDGETPNYATLALQNNNGVPSITCEFRTYLDYYTNLSYCEYYDTAQIYYRITAPSKLNPSVDSLYVPVTRLKFTDKDYYGNTCIQVRNDFPSTNQAIKDQYAPELWDKTRWMTLRIPGFGMDNPIPAGATIEFQWVIYGNPNWINDSFRSRSSFETFNDSYNHITHSWNTPRYENTCGDVNQSGGVNVNPSLLKPRFRARPLPRIAVYSQQTFYWSNPTNTGSNNTVATNNPTNDPTGERYAEYFVKLPPWLNLDTIARIDDAFIIRHRDSVVFYSGPGVGFWRPTINSGVFHGIDADGWKSYSVKYHGSVDGVLDIRLIPGECPEEVVIYDTLQIWIDWVSGSLPRAAGDPEEMCRNVFKKTSKVFTELEFICTPPALAIDTFGVYRITRGLRDSDNDHLPDDGTLALDEEIDHRHFLEGDTGYYFFQGYVGGSSSQRFDKLVLVLRYGTGGSIGATTQYRWGTAAGTAGAHTTPLWEQGTISIKRWNEEKTSFTEFTLPLDIPVVSNQDSLIVYYDGGANDYIPRGGDSCYLKVPFRCRLGTIGNIRGNFYCLTYGIKQNDPTQEWVNKFFPQGLYRIVFRSHNIYARSSYTWGTPFTDPCVPQTISDIYTNTYHAGDEHSNWPNEVRYRHSIEKVVLRVPCGFVRTTDKIHLRMAKWHNSPSGSINWVADAFDFPVVPDLAEEDFLTQDSIFTIDMTQYVDYEYDGSQGYTYDANTGLLSNGKFPPGDDVGGVYWTFKQLYATPASIRMGLTCATTYRNSLKQPEVTQTLSSIQTVNAGTISLNYTGRKLQMELQSYYIMFNQNAYTSLKITNAHGIHTNNDTWLFVKGNVYDALLVDMVTKDTIRGEGLDNCWLNIGTMAGGEIQNHFLIYTYKGKNECTNDTVIVYSAFNASDVPEFSIDTDYGIEQVHMCNRGERKYTELDLLTARIKVAGYIEPQIPNPTKPGYFHYNEGYAMDYVINGKVSQGALNDASVTFRIPVGQVYVDTITAFGIASFEYPQNSGFREIPAGIRANMATEIGSGSNVNTIREFSIHIKDLLEKEVFMMPGWGYTPMNYQDTDRVFTIRIPLVPTCETDLTGTRFRAAYHGKTFCGIPCEDDGTLYITPSILPDVAPEYNFDVKITHENDSRVFSYEQREDKLIVTFKKTSGIGTSDINPNDYVQLRVSDNLAIDGTVTCDPFGNITIDDTWINSEGERFYKLLLPAAELNALRLESPPQDSITFVYTIPLLFTPNSTFDCSAPRQELECHVISLANFDTDNMPPHCPITPFNIGLGSIKVLTLDYDPDIYYTCLNMPNALTFACGSVTPLWYRDSAGTGGLLIADNTFIYTPTIYKDTTFYLRIVYDYDGPMEENFGLTFIKVKMHPLVTSLFSFEASCVGQLTQMRNQSTIGDDDSDDTNTESWQWFKNGTLFSTLREPQELLAANDRVRLLVTSKDGCQHSSEQIAAPFPLPVPTITGSLDTCFMECITYRTEKDMTDYVWTVSNGTPQTPLTGRDSIVVCWNMQSSPIPGLIDVIYTNDNGCRALPALNNERVRVIIRVPPDIPIIEGNDAPCQHSQYTYTYDSQGAVITKFEWTVTSGGTIIAGGDGFNYITILWNVPGSQEITLAIANRAGCVPIDIGRLPVDVKQITRPTITGTNELCIFDTDTYSTQSDMTSYVWTVIGGTIQAGAGTDEVSIRWNVAGTGKLLVRYNNDDLCPCVMVDTFYVTINPLPVPTITGTMDTCFKQCAFYETETGMSNYQWVATNGTIEEGEDTDITVKVCWDKVFDPTKGRLKAIYTDLNGCRGADSVDITVYKLPATPAMTGDDTPCIYSEKTYTYTPQTGFTINRYVWNVSTGGEITAGGETSNNSVTVKWNQDGAQDITLMVTTVEGCNPDEAGKYEIDVQPRVNVNFSADSACVGFATQFTDLTKIGTANATSGNAKSWLWYLEDATTPFATTQNPTFAFAAGEHNIKLVVTSNYDCVGDTTLKIRVHALPTPTITGTMDTCFNQCAFYETQEGMSNYLWTVNNGTIDGDDDKSTVKVCWDEDYTIFGQLFVNYKDANGCTATTPSVLNNINIRELPAVPEITGKLEVCYNSEATYKYVPQTGFNIEKYVWTVTEGAIVEGGNLKNDGNGCDSVVIHWEDAGIHIITLAIIDEYGCAHENVGTLEVEVEEEVIADFTFNTVCLGNETTFTNTSTIGGVPFDENDNYELFWYLNDETTPFDFEDIVYKTLVMGDSIRLKIISNFDCIDEITKVVTIDTLPVPKITGPDAQCFKQYSVFKTEKGMKDYLWTVTNGTIVGANNLDSVVIHWNTVFAPSTGTVTVTYTNSNDCEAESPTVKNNITINPLPATPTISGDDEVCFDSEITYLYVDNQPAFNIVNYIWTANVGDSIDGGTGYNFFTINWTDAGEQMVTLKIIDDNGCTPDNIGDLEVVVEGEVKADFSFNIACLGTPTTFTNLSTIGDEPSTTDNTDHWNWYQNLSTSTFSTAKDPIYTLAWGDSVRLEVISKFGCISEIFKKVTLDTLPIPKITGSDAGCFEQCTTYTTEAGMEDYVWTVTNGTIDGDNDENSVKICWDDIAGANVGTVSVTYTNSNGCAAAMPTEMNNITVYELPPTPEIAGRDKPCFDTEEIYTISIDHPFEITGFTWTVTGGIITDGGTGNDFVKVKWPNFGNFQISLAIEDENGCKPYEAGILQIRVEGDYPKINGEKMACIGVPEVYTTMSGQSGYYWQIEGGKILEGASSNQVKVEWQIPGTGKLSVRYTNPTSGCTYSMITKYEVLVIPCKISDCESQNNKIVTEDDVGVGFYTHLDHDWNLKPLPGFAFDSVHYYVAGEFYDGGVNPSLYGSKYPVRKTTTVMSIGYYYGIPDTCEFTVYVVMACPKSVDDIEENTYTVTPLAGLCWTSNIMSTLYSSGIPIPNPMAYQCPTCPEPSITASIFGLLYNWYDAVGAEETFEEFVQGICPEGYHIPSPEEFDLLLQYQPVDLKSEDYWVTPGTNATDFNSLPAGKYDGTIDRFVDMYGFTGYWSTFGEQSSEFALYYYISYYCNQLLSGTVKKIDALSVRCILDY